MPASSEAIFSNETVNVHALPKYEEAPLHPIDGLYIKIMFLDYTLVFVLLAVVIAGISEVYKVNYMLLAYVLLLLMLYPLGFFLIRKAFYRKKYGIREKDILFQSGLILLKHTIVPYMRIQHIELQESWLAKRFGLAKLRLYTTGNALSIPGLPLHVAQSIQALILSSITEPSDDGPDASDTE